MTAANIIKANSAVQQTLTKDALLNMFISEQDCRHSSRDTYRRTLRQYLNWTDTKGYSLAEATRETLLNYKDELLQNKSSLSVASYITTVRKFYEWTESKLYFPNVAKGLKTPKRQRKNQKQALHGEEVTRLLEALRAKGSLRDYALINLMLRTGLRCIEVTRANFDDITYRNGVRILLIHGKGRDSKDDFVKLTDKAYAPIKEYLDSRRRLQAKEPLFITRLNKRLTTRTVSQIAKDALQAIGLDGKEYTAHSLRHTTATTILRAGGLLEDAQAVLRHASPVTTQVYLTTIKDDQRLQKQTEALIDSIF